LLVFEVSFLLHNLRFLLQNLLLEHVLDHLLLLLVLLGGCQLVGQLLDLGITGSSTSLLFLKLGHPFHQLFGHHLLHHLLLLELRNLLLQLSRLVILLLWLHLHRRELGKFGFKGGLLLLLLRFQVCKLLL
jgi:hypothetical protein